MGYISYVFGEEVSVAVYLFQRQKFGIVKFKCKLSGFGQYFKLYPFPSNSKVHTTTAHYRLQYPSAFRERPKSY